jgi:hypothetical protein
MRCSRHLSSSALALLAACATSAPEQTGAPARTGAKASGSQLEPGWRPGSTSLGGESDDGMVLDPEKGALDQRSVEKVMDRRAHTLSGCYAAAGGAQRYASGEVALRFFVTSFGEVSNVIITASQLGNFAVERCLVAEGKRITFPAPQGGKATDFDYSIQFRSGREMSLVDWDGEVVARPVAAQVPQLGPCGALGPAAVRAVVYIQPGGSVGSVGLASASPLDTEASACAVNRIRKWRLPNDRSHVVRTSFTMNPGVPPTLAAGPPRPAVRLVKRVTPLAR